jgi:hypothetical protein
MTDIEWAQLEADRAASTKAALGRRIDRLDALEDYALRARRIEAAADELAAECRRIQSIFQDDNGRPLVQLQICLAALEAAKGGDA